MAPPPVRVEDLLPLTQVFFSPFSPALSLPSYISLSLHLSLLPPDKHPTYAFTNTRSPGDGDCRVEFRNLLCLHQEQQGVLGCGAAANQGNNPNNPTDPANPANLNNPNKIP
jgi:hypothetical protein